MAPTAGARLDDYERSLALIHEQLETETDPDYRHWLCVRMTEIHSAMCWRSVRDEMAAGGHCPSRR
jgi:hypothetical protein